MAVPENRGQRARHAERLLQRRADVKSTGLERREDWHLRFVYGRPRSQGGDPGRTRAPMALWMNSQHGREKPTGHRVLEMGKETAISADAYQLGA